MRLIDLLIEAGGKEPGKLEVDKTSYDKALEYLKFKTDTSSKKWEKFLQNFEKNYELLKVLVKPGYTERKDMPVVSSSQVNKLQKRLEQGRLDIIDHKNKEFHKSFPRGLSGEKAKKWLEFGLKDGSKKDDIIKTKMAKKTAKSLIPIQRQIYIDTSIDKIVSRGITNAKKYISDETLLIVSKDNYIMDGHHRWAASILLDPKLTLNCLVVDIPKEKLIEFLLAYGDALGNKSNG